MGPSGLRFFLVIVQRERYKLGNRLYFKSGTWFTVVDCLAKEGNQEKRSIYCRFSYQDLPSVNELVNIYNPRHPSSRIQSLCVCSRAILAQRQGHASWRTLVSSVLRRNAVMTQLWIALCVDLLLCTSNFSVACPGASVKSSESFN